MGNGDHESGTTEAPAQGQGDEPCADPIACTPVVGGDERGQPTAREETNRVTVEADSAEAIRKWPRYVFGVAEGQGRARTTRLYLYQPPGGGGSGRVRRFTSDDFQTYMRVARPRERQRLPRASTWGQAQTFSLKVSRIVPATPENSLEFDPNGSVEWAFTVYNLTDAHPDWLRYIKRTLAAYPIEHLQHMQLKSVFLDFTVGAPLGVAALRSREERGARNVVVDGGSNWPIDHVSADQSARAVACATYSALNREWSPNTARAPSGGDPTGAAFGATKRATTIYHESGHLYQLHTPTDEAAAARHRHINLARTGELWDEYRRRVYGSGGGTQGPGEGFAEAFRGRMQGTPLLPITDELQQRVDDAFKNAGIPSLAAYQAVQQRISSWDPG